MGTRPDSETKPLHSLLGRVITSPEPANGGFQFVSCNCMPSCPREPAVAARDVPRKIPLADSGRNGLGFCQCGTSTGSGLSLCRLSATMALRSSGSNVSRCNVGSSLRRDCQPRGTARTRAGTARSRRSLRSLAARARTARDQLTARCPTGRRARFSDRQRAPCGAGRAPERCPRLRRLNARARPAGCGVPCTLRAKPGGSARRTRRFRRDVAP